MKYHIGILMEDWYFDGLLFSCIFRVQYSKVKEKLFVYLGSTDTKLLVQDVLNLKTSF